MLDVPLIARCCGALRFEHQDLRVRISLREVLDTTWHDIHIACAKNDWILVA